MSVSERCYGAGIGGREGQELCEGLDPTTACLEDTPCQQLLGMRRGWALLGHNGFSISWSLQPAPRSLRGLAKLFMVPSS